MSDKKYQCPCCGYGGLDVSAYANLTEIPVPEEIVPPYFPSLGEPSYEVCACCGFEFGFDDEPGGTCKPDSFQSYLRDWIRGGAIWFDREKEPEGWDLDKQLNEAGIRIPPGSRPQLKQGQPDSNKEANGT